MNDRNLVRGLFLMAISLVFGIGSTKYQFGELGRAGPGLFPAVIAAILFLIALSMVIRAFIVEKVPLGFHIKNIIIIMVALCGFAAVSALVNMIAGIVFMVFVATFAGSTYSWKRNVKIAGGLVLVALAFAKLLGMNLPLY
jgi:hypothetical protein